MAKIDTSDLTFSDNQTPLPEAPAAGSPLDQGLTFAPEDNSPQTVFDDVRGKAYDVPQGISGRAINQQIGVTQESRSKADYFGLVDLGKGFAQNVLTSIPNAFAQSMIESGEIAKESSGWTDNLLKFMPALQGITKFLRPMKDVSNPLVAGPIDASLRLGSGISDQFFPERSSIADFQIETGREISTAIKEMTERFGFKPTNPDSKFSRFMFDFGSGAASVATSIGLLYTTKNPALIASLFGVQQKGSIYDEARGRGIHPFLASGISSVAGGIEGGIEAIGAFAFLQAAKFNNPLKVVFARSLEQSLEEMAQQAGEEGITGLTGIRQQTLQEVAEKIGYAGLLGFALGVPAGSISHIAERMELKDVLREKGIPEAQIEDLIGRASSKTLESGDFQQEVRRVLNDELSAESFTEAERMNGLREVNKQYDEIEANLQVEFAKELGTDELKIKLAEEMTRVDASIQSKIDVVTDQIEDKQVKGRANQLIKESEGILKEIDALEAQKSKMEADAKAVTSVDKKLDSLVKKHDAVEAQLSEILGQASGLKDKLAKRRAGVRADLLARRAEAIVAEIDALEEGQRAVRDLQNASDVKVSAGIEKRLQQLAQQYDVIDEELAGLLIDRDAGTIAPSQLLQLKNQDLKIITKKLGKTMDAVRERLQKAVDSMDAKVDKAFQKLSNRVATIARQNEKKRIHESLKLLRQIKTADIENMTVKERKAVQKLQAQLKELPGSPTIEQLRSFNEQIQLIKEEGKRKFEEIMDMRRQRREAQKELLLAALGVRPGDPSTQEPYLTSQRGKDSVDKKARLAHFAERSVTLAPIRLLEMIDGVEDGAWKQLFIDSVNRVIDSKLVNAQEGEARGIEILKSNGITFEELASKIEVPGFRPVTVSEAMHFYAAMGNDLNLLALIYDNGIPLQVLESIVAALPTKYKTAADEIVAEMSRHAPRLNVAVLNYSDGKEDLPLVEGPRVPMNRDMDPTESASSPQQDIVESLELQADYRQKYVAQGLRRERVNRGENVRLKPIRTGLVEIYFKEVENREHFIAAARAVKDLNALLADEEISAVLVDKFGPDVKNAVQDYVNRVASSTLAKGYRAHNRVVRMIDRFARSSRQAAAFVHLGYNLVSAIKVPVSITAALGRVNPMSMMYGIDKTARNWKEVSEFAYKNDPQLKAAEVSREQQEFKDPLKGLEMKSTLGKIPAHAFDMIRMMDQFTRVALWTGAYEQAKDLKMSEKDAIQFAQETVLRTQPATNAKDLPGLFATNNEVVNVFLQFTHQLSQNYGILTHDLPRAWKGGRRQAAVGMAMGLTMNMLIEYALSTASLPEEPEELTEAMLQGFLMMIPAIGPMLNAIHNGFQTLPPAIDLTVKKPWNAVEGAAKGDVGKVLDNAFYFASVFGKLPYTQIRRTILGAYDLSTGVTDDYRRLIWSEYQLSQGE